MPILIDGNTQAEPYDEHELSTGPDGCHPPFYLFDTGAQTHISGAIPDRNSAERLRSLTWRYATDDPFLDKEPTE